MYVVNVAKTKDCIPTLVLKTRVLRCTRFKSKRENNRGAQKVKELRPALGPATETRIPNKEFSPIGTIPCKRVSPFAS